MQAQFPHLFMFSCSITPTLVILLENLQNELIGFRTFTVELDREKDLNNDVLVANNASLNSRFGIPAALVAIGTWAVVDKWTSGEGFR